MMMHSLKRDLDSMAHRRAFTGLAFALAVFGIAACEAETAAEEMEPLAAVSPPLAEPVKIKEVKATGSGCAAGTWKADIDAASETVVVTFEEFEARPTSARPEISRDCTVSIKVEAGEGRSAVLVAQGQDATDRGVAPNAFTKTYWAAKPEASFKGGATGKGASGGGDLRAPCGGEQELRLENTAAVKLTAAGRDTHYKLIEQRVRFASYACDSNTQEPSAPGASTRNADGSVAPSGIAVQNVNVFGRGCAGHAKVEYTPDHQNFSIRFDGVEMAASETSMIGPNCALVVTAPAPAGYQYALESFELAGTASLPAGVKAQMSVSPHFISASNSLEKAQYFEIAGPHEGPVNIKGGWRPGDLLFAPRCLGDLQVGLDLRLMRDAAGERPKAGKLALTEFGPVKFALQPCNPAR